MPTEEDVVVTFRAPASRVKYLDELAKEDSRSRSAMLLYLIENLDTALDAIRKEKSSAR